MAELPHIPDEIAAAPDASPLCRKRYYALAGDWWCVAALPNRCSALCEPYIRGIDYRVADWFISHIIRCMDRSPSVRAMARRFDLSSRHLT